MNRSSSVLGPRRLAQLGALLCCLPGALWAEEETRLTLAEALPELPSVQAVEEIRSDLEALAKKLQEQKAADLQRKLDFLQAIADSDNATINRLLGEGMDPDCEVPFPAPPGFAKKFEDELLRYYVSCEPGFTALMMAAAMGHQEVVQALLNAGAAPFKTTRRHRTFALWLAGKYQRVEIMQALLKTPDETKQMRISVDLSAQQAFLWRAGKVEFYTPISSGRKTHPTPTGRYVVTNKYAMWKSSIYHEAKMPFFLRLSCGDFGLHAGNLPGYPASHGCIRLPADAAKKLFADVPIGTLVEIR